MRTQKGFPTIKPCRDRVTCRNISFDGKKTDAYASLKYMQ